MKNYMLIDIEKNFNIESVLSTIKEFKEVHISLLRLESYNINIDNLIENIRLLHKEKLIFFYSSNIKNINKIKEVGFNVHYCFIGNEILNVQEVCIKEIKDSDSEVFLFFNKDFLNCDINRLTAHLMKINLPICFYITNTLLKTNEQASFSDIYNFILEINKNWSNPLLNKEKNIVASNWKYNFYWNTSEFSRKNLVMGLFGDFSIMEDVSNIKNNQKQMLLSRECSICDSFGVCSERGIGLIMNEYKTQKCLGIKLFEKIF